MDPTEKEIRNYAVWIGLVPEGTTDALTEEDRALACEGLRAGLPPGWRMCETDARAIYYINSDSKSYSWDPPADRHYRALVSQRRAKRSQGGQLSEAEKNAALAALHIVEAPQRSALEKKWEELSEAEKNAAIQLGWEADGTDWPSGEAGERWDGYASMSAMTKEQQDHWATLGFGDNAWDAWIGECPSKARPRWGNQHSGHLTHQNEARDSGQAPRHAEGATNAQLYILRYKPRIEEVIYLSEPCGPRILVGLVEILYRSLVGLVEEGGCRRGSIQGQRPPKRRASTGMMGAEPRQNPSARCGNRGGSGPTPVRITAPVA